MSPIDLLVLLLLAGFGFGFAGGALVAWWVLRNRAWRSLQDSWARASEVASDAARFRWLTEDHDDPEKRIRQRDILERMPVMSYAAAVQEIDIARWELRENQMKGMR